MSIHVRYATEADSPALGHINVASFHHQRYWPNVFPNMDPMAVLPLKVTRSLQKMADPTVHVLAAVDTTAADRVVGYARWTIPGESNPHAVALSAPGQDAVANRASAVPEGTVMPIYEHFFGLLKQWREVYVKEDDIILDFLATSPESQGRGVGSQLLRWGMAQADGRNARVYLEATMDGYPLYKKHGWQTLQEMELDFEPYGGEGQATYVLMMRERARPIPNPSDSHP